MKEGGKRRVSGGVKEVEEERSGKRVWRGRVGSAVGGIGRSA